MIKKILLVSAISLSVLSFGQQEKKMKEANYSLTDFLKEDITLQQKTDRVFKELDDTAIVAQLLMPAIGRYGETEATITHLLENRLIGGLLMLNGSKEGFTEYINRFEEQNILYNNLPFLYSADAEPSLVNRKIQNSRPVLKASEIVTEAQVEAVANDISTDLREIGINYNFAPVVDMSSNKTVGYRGFGADPKNIVPWSESFISISQDSFNIVATAKHFPGHGLVSGDTHKALQVIDGELQELSTYPPLIEAGVLSIMVGHLAVKNNAQFDTGGLPATCSPKIVQDLLRDSLGFQGLIVTDAMNMGGVINVEQAGVKAIDAGCDIVLMPLDAEKTHREILERYRTDADFRKKVDLAAKRIIRMKICLGLL